MKKITLALLTAAAIGSVSIGSASAMPVGNPTAAFGESQIQDVRVVCDRHRRCYNTARIYRSERRYYAPRYDDSYGGPGYGYYGGPGYGYYGGRGYGYGGPSVGIGVGPFGFGVW